MRQYICHLLVSIKLICEDEKIARDIINEMNYSFEDPMGNVIETRIFGIEQIIDQGEVEF